MTKLIGSGALVLTVAVLLVVPFHPEAPALDLLHVITPDTAFARQADWLMVETGGNFVVFALVGIAAFVFIRRPVLAGLAGCALSAMAETAQLVIPGRVASLTDFITNCAGAGVGVAIALVLRVGDIGVWRGWFERRDRQAPERRWATTSAENAIQARLRRQTSILAERMPRRREGPRSRAMPMESGASILSARP